MPTLDEVLAKLLTLPEGDFYDCEDRHAEELIYSDPLDALEEYFDCVSDPFQDIVDEIQRLGPLKITSYRREVLSPHERSTHPKAKDEWVKGEAERLQESLREDFSGEFGMSNGGEFEEHWRTETLPLFEAAVRAAVDKAEVWQCKEVGKVTLTPEEVEVLLREQCALWFEEDEDGEEEAPRP